MLATMNEQVEAQHNTLRHPTFSNIATSALSTSTEPSVTSPINNMIDLTIVITAIVIASLWLIAGSMLLLNWLS